MEIGHRFAVRDCFIALLLFCVAVYATGRYGSCSLDDEQIGFCTLEGGTTGGAGGNVVTASDAETLEEYMDSNDTLIIEVQGTITLSGMTSLRDNKTLIGLGNDARIVDGGLEIYKRDNIIIRNITFVNAPDDCLKINQNTKHIWVDHCTFTDGDVPDPEGANHDGHFDITRQTSLVTISYCVFENHSKTILIGHSDAASDDVGYLKTTLHHIWFKGTRQRHPRVRYGEVHCFNNYYDSNELYGVASACEADVVVEGCYFYNNPFPTYVGYAESPEGDLVERDNIFEQSGTPEVRGDAFDPTTYYQYTLDNTADVPAIVKSQAGAGDGTVGAFPDGEKIATGARFIVSLSGPSPYAAFSTPKEAETRLTVYDVAGREIAVLFNALAKADCLYTVPCGSLHAKSGIYYLVLQCGGERTVRKQVLLKTTRNTMQ